MATRINSIEQLEKALMPDMMKTVGVLADKVYETLNYFLKEYYESYDPISYRRQEEFLRSAVKVEPKIVRGKVIASVYIDYESLDNYKNASGYQVVNWANQGLHGGLDVGDNTPHVWNDTVEAVDNGTLLKLAIQYLKSRGISVRA